MANFNNELIEKAKTLKSVEELLALARENSVEMDVREAEVYFARLNPAAGELSDDELGDVSGGGCSDSEYELHDGDLVQLRPDVNSYNCGCGSVRGRFYRNSNGWSLICASCGNTIIYRGALGNESYFVYKV